MTATTTVGSAFAERTVAAAGFDVRVWEAGDGDPLVCLPGAGGPRLTVALDLLATRFRVALVELPGWGAQPNDGCATLDELATQAAAAIAAAGYDTYHLLGTSFGGACALHLAMLHPERVRSLVLEGPAKVRDGSVPPDQLPPERFARAFRTHPERGPQLAPPDPAFMARVWPLVERLMGTGEVDDAFEARLAALGTRTLVLFGTDDGIIPPHNGRFYRRVMKNSVLSYMYDAAHDVQGDRPEAFADVVGDFLARGMRFLINDADGLINP